MRLRESGSSEHRWYSFHVAGLCFATAMRLIPRRRRFGVAALIARAAAPLVRRTAAYRNQQTCNVDGVREIALHLVINTLTKNGTEFDPVLTVRGIEGLKRALASGAGVLMLSPHTALSLLMVRVFHDAGLDPVVVAVDPRMRVGGTLTAAQVVQPSPTFLVTLRSKLRGGKLVLAMPDRGEHREGRTVEFHTANGRVIVATALMQLAARCEAKVGFFEVHVEEGGVVANIVAPAPAAAGSAQSITGDFIEFVRAHVDSRSAHQR